MKNIKVLIVPDWIEVPIKAMNANLGVLTQPEKLLRILSKDDIAFYIRTVEGFANYCNKELGESINVVDSFSKAFDALDLVSDSGATIGQVIERSIAELGPINNAADYLSFIMKHGANGCEVDPTLTAVGFDVLGYDYDSYILRPKAVSDKDLYQCYEDLFAVMHKYMPTHEIASLPVFRLYESQVNSRSAQQ